MVIGVDRNRIGGYKPSITWQGPSSGACDVLKAQLSGKIITFCLFYFESFMALKHHIWMTCYNKEFEMGTTVCSRSAACWICEVVMPLFAAAPKVLG